jgi:phytoene dehydrogenase-like protein
VEPADQPGKEVIIQPRYDAVVVGSGPNGLAAAVRLAQAGKSVLVIEGRNTIGGGTRTAELTLPGFQHDVCSAIHPTGFFSPFFKSLPLEKYGLEWIRSPAALAHPLEDGPTVFLEGSVAETAACLGRDGSVYRRLFEGMLRDWPDLAADVLGPFPFPPRHPLKLIPFGLKALQPATLFARSIFSTPAGRALVVGLGAHTMLPLEYLTTAVYALVMATLAHLGGWLMARGGSQHTTRALADYLANLGGEIVTGQWIHALAELPPARTYLFDLAPRQVLQIAAERISSTYRRQLERFRYGQGVFKIDYALSGPIPWWAAECRRSATVHLGGTLEEIAPGERAVWHGQHPARPFVLLAQQSLFDPSRAPLGQHTAWPTATCRPAPA